MKKKVFFNFDGYNFLKNYAIFRSKIRTTASLAPKTSSFYFEYTSYMGVRTSSSHMFLPLPPYKRLARQGALIAPWSICFMSPVSGYLIGSLLSTLST